MRLKNPSTNFLLCVKNDGYPVALEVRKLYRVVPDPTATVHRLVRVIDESGEDYLYPEDFFVRIELPLAAKRAFSRAS